MAQELSDLAERDLALDGGQEGRGVVRARPELDLRQQQEHEDPLLRVPRPQLGVW